MTAIFSLIYDIQLFPFPYHELSHGALAEQSMRSRFVMKDAGLFCYRFR